MVTYEQRVAKMLEPGDEDFQLKLAEQYVKRLRTLAKKSTTLEEKLKLLTKAKRARAVVNKIKLNIFDLETMLRQKSTFWTN